METSIRCPKCERPLAAGALQGLCPECLLRAGFATGTKGPARAAPFVPPTPAELAPLFPQFEILSLIGQGGMGAVYRARQPGLDRIVALKILPPQAGRDPGFAERFTREARALARLSHPHIVAVYEFGAAGDYHYFAMEFVDGVTLRHLLATGRPTPREALAIVPQVCDALQFAHDRGIVHRDIKPENILIDKTGVVKIADFGLAKLAGVEEAEFSLTGAHDVMGTPHYMAPEQVEHPLEVDHRADIYSLGVVFYQLLTGELPLGRFAPPSRKVQIDVRLDEVVLRALEKEPEHRYQQANGMKSEVETIAVSSHGDAGAPETGSGEAAGESTRAIPLSHETPRRRWLMLAPVWILAALLLALHARSIDRYLDLAGRLGLRGASAADTPLQQMYPSFAADAQMWVRHALALAEGDKLQLRHTDVDNAPDGREVHWNSAWAWCIAGAGKLHQFFTGLPFPRAVERATLWFNPLVLLTLIVVVSSWAARRLGAIAGVVIAVAMLGHDRMYEGFFPSYVDHHGLEAVAVFGLVLGAIVMGGGWWQRRGGSISVLPNSPAAARKGAVFSALCGAFGLWISAASAVPGIAIVVAAGLFVVLARGRAAVQHGATFDAAAWRLWGRLGAAVSFGFYLLEYFPGHLGFRLEANHPLHALAWLGGGELVAQLGARWLAPRHQRWQQPGTLLWLLLALAVAGTIFVGRQQVLSVFDPFISSLHRGYITEFLPLPRMLGGMDGWSIFRLVGTDSILLLAAIVTLAGRRSHSIALWFAVFIAAALIAMGWFQARWLLNAAGAAIALLLVLLACWTARYRPAVRWAVALGLVGVLFLPNAIRRCVDGARDVSARRVNPGDAAGALDRDIAAALRASQPAGDIVLLASPNASVRVGYYGRIKTLGTLYWENGDGLKSAARIFSARTPAEAADLVRAHGVTHVAIVSDENFIQQYYKLLHPASTDQEARNCFGLRLMLDRVVPQWLQMIPYRIPDDLKSLKTGVMLFKVNFDQSLAEAVEHVKESQGGTRTGR